MNCRNCDYPLWNLKARQCPECGTAFLPVDYEFVSSSVQYCCPHCDQSYYGLGEKGHLVPRSFACVSCGRHIEMDECVLRPTEGVKETQTQVEQVHWHERRRLGVVKAWWLTVLQVLGRPTRLGEVLASRSRPSDGWVFMWWMLLLYSIIGIYGSVLLFAGFAALEGDTRSAQMIALWGLVSAVGIGLGTWLFLLIWAVTAHVILAMTGGVGQPLARTMEAFCYSSGILALAVVPLINWCTLQYVVPIWWIVAAILILWKAQGVHGGRATLAGLAWPVLSFIILIVIYMVMMFAMVSSVRTWGGAGGAAWNMPQWEVQVVLGAVQQSGFANNGVGPKHGLELVLNGPLREADLLATDSATRLADVPVGSSNLEAILGLTYTRRTEALRAEIDGQPDDVIAHRVGDFVFTHHGLNLQVPRGLWVVVFCDDPDAMGTRPALDPVWVGVDDGTIASFSRSTFAADLATQNALRQQVGLPPLPPDLLQIRHQSPAVDQGGPGP